MPKIHAMTYRNIRHRKSANIAKDAKGSRPFCIFAVLLCVFAVLWDDINRAPFAFFFAAFAVPFAPFAVFFAPFAVLFCVLCGASFAVLVFLAGRLARELLCLFRSDCRCRVRICLERLRHEKAAFLLDKPAARADEVRVGLALI